MEDFNNDPDSLRPPQKGGKIRALILRLGLGAFTISLIAHVIFAVIAIFFLYKWVYPPEEKLVDFVPGGGGGGSGGETAHKVQQQQQKRATSTAVSKRIASTSNTAVFSLPDSTNEMMDSSLPMEATNAQLGSGGGSGGGHGKGAGTGTGFGTGLGNGFGTGKGAGSVFGMMNPAKGALVGTFYDLKQDSRRKPTGMTDDEMRKEVKSITSKGFKDRDFRNFYHASTRLYQTKLFMPTMDAEGAPAAFSCEKEVEPRRWIVVYRGTVKAPKSGKFRFVGAGDDLLTIRFNNRPVFDYGYTFASTGTHMFGKGDEVNGKKENRDLEKEIKRESPMRTPIRFYQYDTTPSYNKDIGGLAVGPEFEVTAGMNYPIEIMIGEIPGGFFSVALLIEEIGANYQTSPTGAPILPVFRMDSSPLDPKLTRNLPPVDLNGPIWRGEDTMAVPDF